MLADRSPYLLNPGRSELPNSILQFYFDYWTQKRRGRQMPSRADIHPHELKPYLGYCVLAEALPGFEDFRYRLIGTRVTDYFLSDATGHTIREAYGAAERSMSYIDLVVRIHRTACVERSPMLIRGPYGEWKGHFYPEFDVAYFPLSDDGENANMVLEAFTFDDTRLRALRGTPILAEASVA